MDAAAHAADLVAQLVCKYMVSLLYYTEAQATNFGDFANKFAKNVI